MANGDERNVDVVERERALRDGNYKSRAVCDAAWRHVAAVMGSKKMLQDNDKHFMYL